MEIFKLFKLERCQAGDEYGYERRAVLEYYRELKDARHVMNLFEYLNDDNDVYYKISKIEAVEIDGKIYEINEIKLNKRE